MRNSVRSVLIIFLVSATSFMIAPSSFNQVHGALSLSSNPYDTYTQHWTGLRPSGDRELVNYDQRAMNVASDSFTSAQFIVEANRLVNGNGVNADGTLINPDQVSLGFLLNANSRLEIKYSKSGPNSFSGPLSIPSNAVDTGIHCNPNCGAWVTMPTTFVYFGAPIRSGNYNQIWVCADGYVSVTQDANCNNYAQLGAGIIAPFSRSLWMDSSSHVWTWTTYDSGNGYSLWVAWDKMMDGSITTYQNRESFVLWIRDTTFSHFGNSDIQFLYNSITPSDGMVTAVGIADQYGKNSVSFDSTTISNNNYVSFTEQNTLRYLNSLSVTISDTSNGALDGNAKVYVDGSANIPVSYNLLMKSTVADSSTLLPGWAKLAMDGAGVATGIYAASGLIAATTFGAGGLLLGGAALGLDTYDLAIHSYWDPILAKNENQSVFGQSTSPVISAHGSQDGSTSGLLYLPLDASLGQKLVWAFNDGARNVPHHLRLMATVGYTDSQFGPASDLWSVQTSVDLDVSPDYSIIHNTFEPTQIPPPPSFTTPSGATAWTVTTNCPQIAYLNPPQPRCYEGSSAAYAKDQASLNDQAVFGLGNIVNYAQLIVMPHLWMDDQNPETLYIDYYSQGSWTTAVSYSSLYQQTSAIGYRAKVWDTEWINPFIVIPSTATMLRFRFGTTCCSGWGQGVYLDDLRVFGDGPGNSAPVTVSSQTSDGASLAATMAIDGSAYYSTPDNFLESFGTHTVYASTQVRDNTGTSLTFQKWSDGIMGTSRQIPVPGTPQLIAIYGPALSTFFTYTPSNVQVGQPIEFTATASGGTPPYAYSWNFGDGSPIASGATANHVYSSAANYSVTLTTTDSISASASATMSVQAQGGFQLSANPASVTTVAGQAGTSTITVTDGSGFSGPVNLSASITPSTGLTCSFTQNTVIGSGTSTLLCNGSVGIYAVTVLGVNGPIFSYAPVTFTVQDFTVSSAPSSLTVPTNTGREVSYIIVSVPSGTFTGTVNFSATSSSSSITAIVNPTSSNAPGTSWLAVSSTTPGSYTVTVIAKSGNLQHSVTVPVTVQNPPSAPSFSYYPSHPIVGQPINFTATKGTSPPYTYSWNFGDGRTGTGASVSYSYVVHGTYTVTLTQTDSLGHMATSSQLVSAFAIPLVTSFSYTPSSPVSFGQTVGFAATFNGSTSPYTLYWTFGDGTSATGASVSHAYTTPGTYTVVETITSASSETTTNSQTVIVGDYAMYANPSPAFVDVGVGISQGGTTSSTITAKSLSGFYGTVSLQASLSPLVANGPTISLTSSSIAISANGYGTSTLNIASSSSTPFGSYTISLTSTTGSLSHPVTINLKVIPSPIQFSSTATFSGVTATVTATFINDGTSSSLIGTTYVSARNNTSGVTIVSNKATSMTLGYSGNGNNGNVKYIMSIATSPYWLSMDCVVDVTGGTGGACAMMRTLDIDHNGVKVDIIDLATASNAYGTTIGQPNYNPLADVTGDGKVDISDLAQLSYYYQAYEFLP